MFHGLGQYSAEDIAAGADPWAGSIYEVKTVQPPTSIKSEGLLPILQNVVSGAATVLGSWFQMQGAKEQAAAIKSGVGVVKAAATTPVTTTRIQTAGFDLGGSLPILGILAIGAFLVLRKGKGAPEKKRRRRS